MGNLVPQHLPTFFQGVSRQPDTVRLPGQVEEGDNSFFSVVSGGFEKRVGSEHVAKLSAIGSEDIFVHMYERDETERYVVVIKDDDLLVYDADGNAKTVTFPDGKSYLNGNPLTDFSVTTIADYTIIANRTVTVAMASFTAGTITGNKKAFTDLPTTTSSPAAATGQIYRVTGGASTMDDYFVTWDAAKEAWVECADPTIANAFDASTMPHSLIRNGDGTFTFKKITWSDRKVGDAKVVPNPDFVGYKINDVTFHRNRLTILSDETVYFSQAGDYWNLWPDKATEVLDSDPFGVTASSDLVNILRFAVPFRKALFTTGTKRQFEVSGDMLTPKEAAIHPVTSYSASMLCRPYPHGDELYFAADNGSSAVLFEYYYDDAALSNTAHDVTKHCAGYIPAPVVSLCGDTVSGTVFALSSSERSSLYVYRVYWQDTDKAQSAWSRWTFGDSSHIHGIGFLNGQLHMLIRRADGYTYLERINLDHDTTPNYYPFKVRLDSRALVTGTYDSGTNLTSWTLPFGHHNEATGILSTQFAVGKAGKPITPTYHGTNVVKFEGDYSGDDVIFGIPYTSSVTLSKQYVREGEKGRAITSGRLQLRSIQFDYKDTGYFEVHITPEYRDTKIHKFTGRVVGSGSNIIGRPSIMSNGNFKVRVGSRGDTVVIKVVNPSPMPHMITSAQWVGFFNDTARVQGNQ